MAVLGRVVLVGLAAGGYAAWRALQQGGSATGAGVQGSAGRLPGTTGSARGTGSAAGAAATDGTGAAGSVAAATAASAATMPDEGTPVPPDPTGGTTGTGTAAPAVGADVEAGAGTAASGTRGDDPLTGITEDPAGLPEATATPDGTPAASPVETRRVGDDPA